MINIFPPANSTLEQTEEVKKHLSLPTQLENTIGDTAARGREDIKRNQRIDPSTLPGSVNLNDNKCPRDVISFPNVNFIFPFSLIGVRTLA